MTELDLRKVFEEKEIDAVAVAMPNHWHALATIWACQAGKHVYCEKPCSHNIFEGRKMVEAARKYDRFVEVGFQNRSIKNVRSAMEFLRSGKLGRIYMARGLCFKPRDAFKKFPDTQPPKELHWDMWVGPAEMYPYNEGKCHYNWHWHWNTGNGDTGNQGPHQFDVARWGLNKNEHPVRISSFGGFYKFEKECTQETPNTQTSLFEYADGTILEFGTRGLYTNGEPDVKIGNLFYGTEGWMQIDGSNWKTFMGRKNEPGASSKTVEASADPMNLAGAGADAHFDNFIYALAGQQAGDAQLRYRGRLHVHLPAAPGEYLLSPQTAGELRRQGREVRQRSRGRQAADAQVSRSVHRARKGLMRWIYRRVRIFGFGPFLFVGAFNDATPWGD